MHRREDGIITTRRQKLLKSKLIPCASSTAVLLSRKAVSDQYLILSQRLLNLRSVTELHAKHRNTTVYNNITITSDNTTGFLYLPLMAPSLYHELTIELSILCFSTTCTRNASWNNTV